MVMIGALWNEEMMPMRKSATMKKDAKCECDDDHCG